jgi:gamma-glutamyltranspeptidase
MCALGGDVMALVHAGEPRAVNGSGRAAMATRPRAGVAVRGPGSITVPGAVAAWEEMASRWGTLPLAAALRPAAAMAADGVAVAPSLARAIAGDAGAIAADAGLGAVFAPGGRGLREGERLVQPALAETLGRIAAGGAEELYRGRTGAELIAGLARLGCPLEAADLAAHRTDVEAPLTGRFGGREIVTMGPNSQGFCLLQVLAAVERLSLDDPLGAGAPVLARLFALAAADRDRHLADAGRMRVGVEELVGAAHVAAMAERAVHRAAPAGPPPPRPSGDTVAVVAADGSGLGVSLIQSVFHAFGAGILEPATGIVCHNRGACFAADPAGPNAPAPGVRPLHTLMPVAVLRGGRLAAVTGTMGGRAQPQIHAQVLLRLLAGDGAQAAVSAPRFVVGELEAEGGAGVLVEPGAGGPSGALAAAGLVPVALPAPDEATGHAHAIAAGPGGLLDAGSDPRADGAAAAGG